MSISTLESRDSIVMLDRMDAEQEAIEQAREVYQQQLLAETRRDMNAPAPFYGVKHSVFSGTARLYTVREALADLVRDSSHEITVEQAVELIARAARGEDIKAQADNFLLRMANYFADMKVRDLL